MFEISQNNQLKEMKVSSLANEGISEKDLQDWIAENPKVLGIDFYGPEYAGYRQGVEQGWQEFQQRQKPNLLIIQKEYGFEIDGVHRSLDLLALDVDFSLVLIELKAEPAKRGIVAQAAAYRSHIKNLDTKQIIDIYQKYLDGMNVSESAEENIKEFLESYHGTWKKENDPLNQAQVILLVAEKFEGDVFATVEEAFGNSYVSCLNIDVYSSGDQKFLTCNQVWFNKEKFKQDKESQN